MSSDISRKGYNVKALRFLAWKRQNGHCYFCDRPTWLPSTGSGEPDSMATLEHLLDLDRGGSWHGSNLACSCLGCNNKRAAEKHAERKGDRDLIQQYSRSAP